MRMLLLVFRQSLDHDLQQLLKEPDVKGFTEAPTVFGLGEAGTAFNSMAWPGSNCMILAAMGYEQAAHLAERLLEFRDRLAAKQHHAKVPLRIFPLPCVRFI
jgi:hypothetical protein